MIREKIEKILSYYIFDDELRRQAVDKLCEEDPRKPVAICIENEYQKTLVACNDGSIFWFDNDQWHYFQPVPGTRADIELKTENKKE